METIKDLYISTLRERVPVLDSGPQLKETLGRRPRSQGGGGGVHRTQEKTERLARFPFFSAVLFVGRNVGRKLQ
jgi:hypothetical protein